MANIDTVVMVQPTDILPTSAAQDGVNAYVRGDRRRHAFVNSIIPTKHLLSAEGSAWGVTTPTPGTAVTYALQTTFSDTVGFVAVRNIDPVGGRTVTIDKLRIITVAVAATVTSVEWAVKIDNINRTPTAGFTTLSPANTRFGGAAPAAQVFIPNAGSLTVPAASAAARLIGRGTLRSVIPVAKEVWSIFFGAVESVGLSAGTTAGSYADHASAFTLNPGDTAMIHLWQPGAATTTPTFELEISGWDR